MKYLPSVNTIITSQTGDGFRAVLKYLIEDDDLVITHTAFVDTFENDNVTTLHRLHKIDEVKYRRVIIDCQLPNPQSKQLERLCEICKGEIVIFINPIGRSYMQTSSLAKIVVSSGSTDLRAYDFTWDITQSRRKRKN